MFRLGVQHSSELVDDACDALARDLVEGVAIIARDVLRVGRIEKTATTHPLGEVNALTWLGTSLTKIGRRAEIALSKDCVPRRNTPALRARVSSASTTFGGS